MKRVDMYFKITKNNNHARDSLIGIRPFVNYDELREFLGWKGCYTATDKLHDISQLLRRNNCIIDNYRVMLVCNEKSNFSQATNQLIEEYYDAKISALELLKENVDKTLIDIVDGLINNARDEKFYFFEKHNGRGQVNDK